MGLFKTYSEKEVKRVMPIVDKINGLEPEISKLSDEELTGKTQEFKKRLNEGETLDDILPEAFAVVREASKRVLGMRHFDVQLIGGIILHQGRIAEMKTGEGKTLVATLPVYLNALTGKGVHVVTTNEYLSSRNAEWMRPIYDLLGVSVGINLRELSPKEKQEAYSADITYSTNNEVGFDYLRDNMVVRREDRVQRGLNFCIIDEVDSILIDEARTPLIISGGQFNTNNLYVEADRVAKRLKEEEDYTIDLKTKSVSLTAEGSKKVEKFLNITNLYDLDNTNLVHHINQALKANYGFKKDIDYVVDNDAIIIVDPFTGRLMHGRQYSEGLHQAIEAKEGVTINTETKTMATITFQNLFRMYNKLSGMTGTAKTEEEEFRNIYNMFVIQIPTNREVIREDLADLVFATKKAKFNAIVDEIEKRHKMGQPILVGTIAIETSELVSKMLDKKGIKHEVLNAKNHAREAEIIAKAGEKNSVTIATNMAGRGTDIKLGDGVRELGGLCVIGTERHESRRIDNQLRGRAGRQGDPGVSQFFVSLEDELMVRFGTDRIKALMQSAGFDEQAIRSKIFTSSIEGAQKRVEGNNFDIRKQLLQYDNVMNEHREIIYRKRNEILDQESIHENVLNSFKDYINNIVIKYLNSEEETRYEELTDYINKNLLKTKKIKLSQIENKTIEDATEIIYELLNEDYEEKIKEMPWELVNEFEKAIALRVIDTNWMNHINNMEHLKEGIGLRGYANEDPLQAYIKEGYQIFDNMMAKISEEISMFLLRAEVRQNIERKEVAKPIINNKDEKTLKGGTHKKEKIGRNDPCPCGSGKKYKNCCGK